MHFALMSQPRFHFLWLAFPSNTTPPYLPQLTRQLDVLLYISLCHFFCWFHCLYLLVSFFVSYINWAHWKAAIVLLSYSIIVSLLPRIMLVHIVNSVNIC